MPTSRARLPITIDAGAIGGEVAAVGPAEWVAHFNQACYSGDWSGAALRSVGGVAGRIYPDPAAVEPFADTPLLARCPATRAALDLLESPKLSARFLRLGPGAEIKEHRDYNLGYEDGEVRIHIPIVTGHAVEFIHDHQRVDMAPGEAWYLDLNLTHAVFNRGREPRVHLVVDCVVNDWLAAALGATREGSGRE